MSKRLTNAAAILLLFLFSPLVQGEASDAEIDRLLDLSGLTDQVDQFPAMVKEGMKQARQQGTPISDSALRTILSRADDTIVASEILDEIRSAVKKSLGKQDIQRLLRWYESDLGREITAIETKASTPEAYNEMIRQAESLLAKKERVEHAR